jgi:phosphoribosyl-ATP pyrophosphohydrolase
MNFEELAKGSLKEFIVTFGASVDVRLWFKLVQEEMDELKAELAHGNKEAGLKEMADLMYVVSGVLLLSDNVEFLPDEEAQEDLDLLNEAHKTIGDAVQRFGFTREIVEEAFARVHLSNMSKLDDAGKPVKREDGKILKGPNYKAPDMKDLVE